MLTLQYKPNNSQHNNSNSDSSPSMTIEWNTQ